MNGSAEQLRAAMLGSTSVAAEMLERLRGDGAAVVEAFPELAALAYPAPPQVEHDAGTDRPLLDHVATRLFGKKLAGLEAGDLARFQQRGLGDAAFARLGEVCARVMAAGLGPALRAALMHLDIAKTASPALREAWTAQGISVDVHNEAAAAILRRADRPWPMSETHRRLAFAWIEAHGLAGQHVRGEGPLAMYAPLLAALRGLDVDAALALDGLHVIDACDTGAVREGLLDDALLAKLRDVNEVLREACRAEDPVRALADRSPRPDRAWLCARLVALRGGRQADGVDAAVAAIGETEMAVLAPALATCQLWYCEAATSALSPAAQLGVLAAAVGAARTIGVDVARPWHAQLRPLVARLHGDSSAVRYRLRLVEAALAALPIRALLTGGASLGPLGTLSARLAHPTSTSASLRDAARPGKAGPCGPDAIVVDYADTEESAALITLLGIYETKSQAVYHTMLKALCDLYGLRKDEFDRVANEASYLESMNAARSDKERMLDYVAGDTIVEIGPGGGVVLDLLAARFPRAEIIGVDLSREVVAALERRRKRWRVVLGAAEQLGAVVPAADTVVFCSILHEVYSYTEPKFQLASVERVVRAAFDVLRPGGRIVIRDGVRPPPGTRRIALLAADARATLELYCAQFEGRRITYRELAPGRVEMTAPDAMEFLYTYTWGPASFPYEVRELYGIMEYDAYVAALLAWCGPRARVVPNPLGSYLQPGYRAALAGKIELTDEHDRPVELPDSNCLIVIEKSTDPSRG